MSESKLCIPVSNVGQVSDGYHTFDELYHHRSLLFIAFLKKFGKHDPYPWWSLHHYDGSMYPGYFIVGVTLPDIQKAISYHLKLHHLPTVKACGNIEERNIAPICDHDSDEVLIRLIDYIRNSS